MEFLPRPDGLGDVEEKFFLRGVEGALGGLAVADFALQADEGFGELPGAVGDAVARIDDDPLALEQRDGAAAERVVSGAPGPTATTT